MRFSNGVLPFLLIAMGVGYHAHAFTVPSLSCGRHCEYASFQTPTRQNALLVAAAKPSDKVMQTAKSDSEKEEETKWQDERQWLTWVYKRMEEAPVGELSAFVLRQMIPAMTAWARRKSSIGAERAEFLLQRYVDEHLAGNKDAVLQVRLFNICMDAWAKSRRSDAPERVNDVLRWMKELRQKHSIESIRPDVVSMSTLVAAWAKSGAKDACARAEAIVTYMEENEFNPNTITYNTVLHACATSPLLDKAIRAEKLVQRMVDRYESGKHPECEPDVCTYQSLILAWARSGVDGAPQKAEEVLRFLECEYQKGNHRLEPNAHCFSAAIHAWSNSMEPQKARRAYTILQHIRNLYEVENNKRVKPNPIAFTSVINACSSPVDESEKEAAFNIAQLAMEELWYSKYGNANFVTYAAFLNVCATTLVPGEETDEIVERTFHRCCRAGQVGYKVLEKLKLAATPELYESLLKDAFETNDNGRRVLNIPEQWTRNVKGEKHNIRKGVKSIGSHKKLSDQTWDKLREARELQGSAGFYSQEEGVGQKGGVTWTVDTW